jgi:hypothetical protein
MTPTLIGDPAGAAAFVPPPAVVFAPPEVPAVFVLLLQAPSARATTMNGATSRITLDLVIANPPPWVAERPTMYG